MLTVRLASGAGLLLATSILGRMLAIASQVVTGLLLSEDDFGIYAIAIGFQTAAGLTRGGDAQSYLVTLPPTARRRRVGTVFAISVVLYLIGIVPVLCIAPQQAARVDAPVLVPLIWVLCAALLTSPIRYVLRARINARLDFRRNAVGAIIGEVTAYSLTVLLALVLRNPLALAIPVLIAWIAELVYLWNAARPSLHDFVPSRRFVMPVLHQLRGLIAVAAMVSLWTSGDYLVAGFLVSTAVLGTYFFGYQLAAQPSRMFTASLMNVLVPVVCRVMDDRDRLRSAIRRLLGAGGLAIALVNMGLVAGMAGIERFIWQGRWAEAVYPVQVLSIGLVFSSLLGILTSPFMAERRYLEAFLCNLIRAVGLIGGVAFGAAALGTADGMATSVALTLLVSSIVTTAWVGGRYGLAIADTLPYLFRCTLPIVLAGSIAALLGDVLLDSLGEGRLSGLLAGGAAALAYLALCGLSILFIPASVRLEVWNLLRRRRS